MKPQRPAPLWFCLLSWLAAALLLALAALLAARDGSGCRPAPDDDEPVPADCKPGDKDCYGAAPPAQE